MAPTQAGVYHNEWPSGLASDDMMWQQALMTQCYWQEYRQPRAPNFTHDERILSRLIRQGIHDVGSYDKNWDSSIRSMRHSAAMADRLWAMLEIERERVRIVCYISTSPF